MAMNHLGWSGILRLGLVQAALGSIVVITTSTLNRVMVVELSLSTVIPGLLVGLHYAVQLLRPLWGHASDAGRRRSPWIIGGIAVLGLGGIGATAAVALMQQSFAWGMTLAVSAFVLIGVGVGAAGTSLLALLASTVSPERRPAAATVVWLMMIAGMAVTAIVSGMLLEPFGFGRLIAVVTAIAAGSLALTILALAGVERGVATLVTERQETPSFRRSLTDAWSDPKARLFTVFVFVSMLAFSAQDLILEPFAGLVFGLPAGETTQLAGLQHGGVFVGMVITGLLGGLWSRRSETVLRTLTVGGCVASAAALIGLSLASGSAGNWPLRANVLVLGVGNGIFAVAAIGSMMALAGASGAARTGMRMGLWGAAQGIAFGAGGLAGATVVDILQRLGGEAPDSYGAVFAAEAFLFLLAAAIAARVAATKGHSGTSSVSSPTFVTAP